MRAPVRPVRAADVGDLRQTGAVEVDDVDLAIGVEVEAAGERDLRPVRRPGGLQAPYGSGVCFRSAAAGARRDSERMQPRAVTVHDPERAVQIRGHVPGEGEL